jgi:hypothetical protein
MLLEPWYLMIWHSLTRVPRSTTEASALMAYLWILYSVVKYLFIYLSS